MKTLVITRNKNFTRLISATKNREHDLFGVPLVMVLGALLELIKKEGLEAGFFGLGMICEKVGMFDQLQEITGYIAHNLGSAISEIYEHSTLDW